MYSQNSLLRHCKVSVVKPTSFQFIVTKSPSHWWTWSLQLATKSASSWVVLEKGEREPRVPRPSWRLIVSVRPTHRDHTLSLHECVFLEISFRNKRRNLDHSTLASIIILCLVRLKVDSHNFYWAVLFPRPSGASCLFPSEHICTDSSSMGHK